MLRSTCYSLFYEFELVYSCLRDCVDIVGRPDIIHALCNVQTHVQLTVL